jgi:cysteine synthase
VFKPDTTEREMRRILQASGARVVDGPTVTDAYVLALPAAQAPAALARLRAEPAVTLAQALGTEDLP